jgi:hypothetical protein
MQWKLGVLTSKKLAKTIRCCLHCDSIFQVVRHTQENYRPAQTNTPGTIQNAKKGMQGWKPS